MVQFREKLIQTVTKIGRKLEEVTEEMIARVTSNLSDLMSGSDAHTNDELAIQEIVLERLKAGSCNGYDPPFDICEMETSISKDEAL